MNKILSSATIFFSFPLTLMVSSLSFTTKIMKNITGTYYRTNFTTSRLFWWWFSTCGCTSQ
ncbi:MAG: hypothetical protein GW805_00600 [Ignavibacteria bacterium]|nr:hypothetical protein [Ignavibacteria bacterium]NCS81465.1 hypothetical protein [Ignavibacteria bacterium]